MTNYFIRFIGAVCCFFLCGQVECQETVTARPVEINDVLTNPGIGFTTFQMFNGDNLSYYDVINESDLSQYGRNENMVNENHPVTTIAYFRIQWKFIEPKQGEYRWDFIDGLLDIAQKKGQKVALRISPYKGKIGEDVPDWYRKMVGPERNFPYHKWVVDPENPLYAKYFGSMIRALGNRYDGHPSLESLDVSIVGYAGEGGGTELLKSETVKALVDPYIESFTKTPLIAFLKEGKYIDYLRENAKNPLGWRQDCLGDLDFWANEQNGWTHMFDYYPQKIISTDMVDAWKNGHVTFEMCGLFKTWDKDRNYSDEQVQYIIDQSLKWHISSFNAKSTPVPEKWKTLVDDWLKKMGYRFVLRSFKYPSKIKKNGRLKFETWWENKGVAPCYLNYPLAIRIKNKTQSELFITDADITKWLPGDIVFNASVFPQTLPEGKYEIQIALVDEHLFTPVIKLAIEGIEDDGWYSLGEILLEK